MQFTLSSDCTEIIKVTTRLKGKGEGQKVNSELKRILYHSKEVKKDT